MKRNGFSDMIKDPNIDVIGIQETKKKDFSKRFLKVFEKKIGLPACGKAGGVFLDIMKQSSL